MTKMYSDKELEVNLISLTSDLDKAIGSIFSSEDQIYNTELLLNY